MAEVEGAATTDTAPMDDTSATSDMAPVDGTATCDTTLADTESSSDTAPADVRAEADATTEGITSTDCTAMQSVTDAPSLDLWEQEGVPSTDEVQILARHLQSQCPERQHLALRELLVLSVDPSMAKSICSLSEHLLELLRDGDGELVRMTLSIFRNVLRDEEDREGFSPIAPRLAEALRPLFDHDNSHVQLLSIRLFREVMELVAEEGTWLWEKQAWQSLVPLFFRWQDENQRVAEAAREALLWAARFLQRRDLEQLVKTEQHFGFCDCLMEKELSRRGEHLRQALPFLQSPQEPLREAAVRFMGVAGWHMREQQEDLWPILKALGAMSEDDCPSTSNLRNALMATYRSAVRAPRAPLRRPMSLQPLGTTAQGPLPSAAAAPADAGPN
ncbi:maestro heat-like repeat-containing protein family member 6 isoform X2 [Myiozetetes cayanensis]|uniref:maestro heat-like repeat-containing protein family member 6 isoform X1 n=1 Tax=Myiozetetes cayanensis TaxID=478635 RepID=UPI00215E7810|nr:maestro heat-like repeat-containing protein family member 6 isoform X1 [Myiozetetes cayanensis]XP_050192057.1 maestro heat-like repeat-containing protein family member 6 isoform X2 [Myiozetetes cayanensis]